MEHQLRHYCVEHVEIDHPISLALGGDLEAGSTAYLNDTVCAGVVIISF